MCKEIQEDGTSRWGLFLEVGFFTTLSRDNGKLIPIQVTAKDWNPDSEEPHVFSFRIIGCANVEQLRHFEHFFKCYIASYPREALCAWFKRGTVRLILDLRKGSRAWYFITTEIHINTVTAVDIPVSFAAYLPDLVVQVLRFAKKIGDSSSTRRLGDRRILES